MAGGTALPEDFTKILLERAHPAVWSFKSAKHGLEFLQARRYDQAALALDDAAMELGAPDWLWILAGYAYLAAGNIEEALYFFGMALTKTPAEVMAHYCAGLARYRNGELHEAAAALASARILQPDFVPATVYEATFRCELHQYSQALALLESLPERYQSDVDVLNQTGLVLVRGFGRARDAMALFERALAQIRSDSRARPTRALLMNQALALRCASETEAALAIYDELLREHDEPYVRWQRSLALLSAGDFRRAWQYYGDRWTTTGARVHDFRWPRWQPPSVDGETVAILSEQGLGDQILFASCIPDFLVQDLPVGGHALLECDARLASLFQRSFPQVSVVARQSDNDDVLIKRLSRSVCRQIFIGDLPQYYRASPESFARSAPFLCADASLTARWQTRLAGAGPGLKIGISWRGGTDATNGHLRSLQIPELLPLVGMPDCQFVSLQYGEVEQDLQALSQAGTQVLSFPEALTDYDNTAALINALDCVVSVCTSVVHLAGGLGKYTLVLVPAVAEWVFGGHGDSMPWYPSIRLFRQSAIGDWAEPVNKLRLHLASDLARRQPMP